MAILDGHGQAKIFRTANDFSGSKSKNSNSFMHLGKIKEDDIISDARAPPFPTCFLTPASGEARVRAGNRRRLEVDVLNRKKGGKLVHYQTPSSVVRLRLQAPSPTGGGFH